MASINFIPFYSFKCLYSGVISIQAPMQYEKWKTKKKKCLKMLRLFLFYSSNFFSLRLLLLLLWSNSLSLCTVNNDSWHHIADAKLHFISKSTSLICIYNENPFKTSTVKLKRNHCLQFVNWIGNVFSVRFSFHVHLFAYFMYVTLGQHHGKWSSENEAINFVLNGGGGRQEHSRIR